MSYILHIESSQDVCSVCIAREGQLVALRETADGNQHAQSLTQYIDELLREHNIAPRELSAVALSQGPGSYTGLRIGSSAAKGLCYGLEIPLIAVDTLQSMASLFADAHASEIVAGDVLCPMIDARRMEVYTAQYSAGLQELVPVTAEIIDSASFEKELSTIKMHFFGSGADKCSQTIISQNAIFYQNFELSSRGLVRLAWDKYQQKQFADIAYFEPLYLKDFVATVSKKSVFS